MIEYSIYVVDDDPMIREGLTMSLQDHYSVMAFPNGDSAVEEIRKRPPDLLLLDIGLPGKSGIEVLTEVRGLCPELLVIVITACEDIGTAVKAMKLAAHDYIVKPLHMEAMEITIRKALETVRLRKEVKSLQEKRLTENCPFFVGESNVIRDVMEFITMVARSATTPVLIVGETGTGKELIARAIHFRSPNFHGPLVTVNCAAIPRDLIESELFGYDKGAFTGARASGKRGLVQQAEGGTLFLDEVADLSLEAQAKLLRFLEGGEFYRVGGTEKLRVQTRVISATNRKLDPLIEKGLFRDDLFYRLGVVNMRVPSLNERREDILPLAKHFLVEYSKDFGRVFAGLTSEATSALESHTWRGNVRELKNMIERGVLAGKGEKLTCKDLGLESGMQEAALRAASPRSEFPPIPPDGIEFFALQEAFEKFYVEQAYRQADRNESKAARLLGMNHHTFRYHRKRLRIE